MPEVAGAVEPPAEPSSADSTPAEPSSKDEGGAFEPVELPEIGDASNVVRHVIRAVATEAPGEPLEGLKELTTIHIVDDGNGLADAVAGRMRARGFQTTLVGSADSLPADAEGVLHLGAAREFQNPDDAIAMNVDLFASAARVAEAMTRRGGVFVVVQDTGGKFGTDEWIDPMKAAAAGGAALVKTAALEWPQASVKVIDLDVGRRTVDGPADELMKELFSGGDAIEVGLPEGERFTFELVEQPPQEGEALTLGASDVVVASGGARGVTAACLLELARRTGARFLLLGRTPLTEESARVSEAKTDGQIKKAIILDAKDVGEIIKPAEVGRRASRVHSSREVRRTLAQFEAVGATARYAAVDVRDVQSLSAELAEVRSDWGAITVLVHGAGVLADKLLADKTMDQFDKVFGTKVYGLYALFAATAQDSLRAIALFSSAAARAGNKGQSDYAMANEVLNKLAQAEAARRDDCVVKSMAWGPWSGGMVTPTLEALFKSRGVNLIEVPDGASAFADELLLGDSDIEVLFGEVEFAEDDRPQKFDIDLPSPAQSDVSMTYEVDARTHPWLADHAVGGTPVLPLVVVVDWFVRAAREIYPGVQLTRLRDVKVLKGVRFEDFDHVQQLVVEARAVPNGLPRVELSLESANGTRHYEAVAELGMSTPPFSPPEFTRGRAWRGTVYDGEALFHGPKFQTVDQVFDLNESGVTADVTPGAMLGWEIEEGRVDPAGLDACLQLVLLWMRAVRDGVALPMALGSFELHVDDWPDEPLEARFNVRHADNHHAVGDLWLRTKDGAPVATLRELKTFVYKRI